jgi:hypothetical protein
MLPIPVITQLNAKLERSFETFLQEGKSAFLSAYAD